MFENGMTIIPWHSECALWPIPFTNLRLEGMAWGELTNWNPENKNLNKKIIPIHFEKGYANTRRLLRKKRNIYTKQTLTDIHLQVILKFEKIMVTNRTSITDHDIYYIFIYTNPNIQIVCICTTNQSYT